MAHRGRLNVLINIVGKSYGELFEEFEGNIDPGTVQGSGDVKYHKGFRGKFTGRSGRTIDVVLSSNPSHLEAVDPVVEGMARAHAGPAGKRARASAAIRSCRCSSTVTRRSPVRAWWPRRSTCRRCPATRRAGPSTW